MSNINTLIVDFHEDDGKTRISDLKNVFKNVTGTEPSYAQQVYGKTKPSQPVLRSVQTDCETVFENKHMVLLHCGSSQHCVPNVLDLEALKRIPCLLYSGGDPGERNRQFAREHSSRCALIPEVLNLTGLDPKQKEKLEDTIQRILLEAEAPGVAVEDVYGDRELETILDRLYGRLVPGVDLKSLRGERDAALEEHYRKRRGW